MQYTNRLGIEYYVELREVRETMDSFWIGKFQVTTEKIHPCTIQIAFYKERFPSEDQVRIFCERNDIISALQQRLENVDQTGVPFAQPDGGQLGEWYFIV